MKIQIFLFFSFFFFFGGGGSGRGGQGGHKPRSEAFVKIPKKKLEGVGGSGWM